MSQMNLSGRRAFKTGAGIAAPLPAYTRVKQVAAADANGFTGTVLLAGPDDEVIGITGAAAQHAGDNVDVILRNHQGTRKVFCASVCSIGDILYGTVNGQTDTLGANGLGTAGGAIGHGEFVALEACATAGGVVEALPIIGKSGLSGLLFAGTADSTATGTSSTAENFFDTNIFSIPANTLKKGDVLKMKARVKCTATHSTDTFAFKLYLGEVLVAAPAAFDAADNDEIVVDATVVVTDIGAVGHVKAFIAQAKGAPATAAFVENTLASTAIDTTAAKVVRGSITVSASDAGNAAVLRDLIVELIRQ